MNQETQENDQAEKKPTVHQQRRRKNWIIMGALIGFIALIWVVTMVKVATYAG